MAIEFSFDLPCKPYVKCFLERNFGDKILITQKSSIGKKLYALIRDPRHDQDSKFYPFSTKAKITLKESFYIASPVFLTKTNITVFNNFLEDLVKWEMRTYVDAARCGAAMTGQFLRISDAIRMFSEAYNYCEVSFPFDTMKKDYYRYRDEKSKKN
jgi:hypothetical protein